MENTPGRVAHLLATVCRPTQSLATDSHAARNPLVVLRRWAERQGYRANRGEFNPAGRRSSPDRSTASSVAAPNQRLRAMLRIAKGPKIERNMEREYDSKHGEFVFYTSPNKETISGVDSKVTPPPSGTCAVAPPLGSSPGTFRIPGAD
jgi:hypothetical protein